jgi:hypothetical protein
MKSIISFIAVIAVISFLVPSCGGGSSPSDQNVTEEETKQKELSPDEIGKAVAELYVAAIGEVAALVTGHPEAAEIEPKLAEMKESYIQKFVELGKKREALDEAGISKADLATRLGISNVYKDESYTVYGEAVTHYFNDRAVHDLLFSFNIITQYASFELLKQQEPEEALRLGIE